MLTTQTLALRPDSGPIPADPPAVRFRVYLETSTKPSGHVYKACATVTDGWRLVNACTGFAY